MKALSIVYTCALLIGLQACKSQTNKIIAPKLSKNNITCRDSLNKPNFNVKVNKEFDSKGNLIRYDSAYSYVYRGKGPIPDSLFNLNHFFAPRPFDMFDPAIKNGFSNDSLLKHLFFGDDFLKRQSELNKLFDGFYPKIDSLTNRQIYYPYFKPGGKTI